MNFAKPLSVEAHSKREKFIPAEYCDNRTYFILNLLILSSTFNTDDFSFDSSIDADISQ
ncbi:hypothetical protein [Psychrobacter sp. DAB_AL62B]|uniref:hypothetical protein n=1 Tax=Psychrobacter sp. DAB_AL62B TaxID=1028420 RepID=UPI0023818EC3|nr:hypothetical protein [Psychrobacter sp. DAB_AL62B]